MYKAMFQNSKIALGFAAMTIVSAVSMVGTSEDGGMLTKAVEIVEAQRDDVADDAQAFAQSRSTGDTPAKSAAGWGNNGAVFGEYAPTAAGATPGQAQAPAATMLPGANAATAPIAKGAIVKRADGTMIDSSGRPVVLPPPVITDRQLSIEVE